MFGIGLGELGVLGGLRDDLGERVTIRERSVDDGDHSFEFGRQLDDRADER